MLKNLDEYFPIIELIISYVIDYESVDCNVILKIQNFHLVLSNGFAMKYGKLFLTIIPLKKISRIGGHVLKAG